MQNGVLIMSPAERIQISDRIAVGGSVVVNSPNVGAGPAGSASSSVRPSSVDVRRREADIAIASRLHGDEETAGRRPASSVVVDDVFAVSC